MGDIRPFLPASWPPAAHSTAFMQIEQLGPYRIGKQLGRGGMGTVYAAVDVQSGAAAAVKVLSPQLATQAGFRERFEAEIESLKKLHHPSIVQLFGYGEQDEVLFYAMELVEGVSLEDELTHGRRFEWREVCQIGIQLCRALKLAHDHGVIHRDIKPANLLLTPAGDVKLTDFGIARLFGNTGLTSEGGVLGTAEYMAPEQADGRRVTHHCDLYSLGGVMYALLAGRPPFRSQSLLEMLQLQRYSTPEPVRRFAPETPVEFEEIIAQLLSKEPPQRFPNALMLSRRLEAMLRGLTIRTETPPEEHEEDDLESADEPVAAKLLPQQPQRSPARVKATVGIDEGGRRVRATLGGTEPGHVAATSHYAPPDESAVIAPAPPPPRPAAATFTTVEEDRRRESELHEAERERLISPATMLLVAALVAIAAVIWYVLQPPSADSLFNKIEDAAATHDDSRLLDVKDEIGKFLSLYPQDPRAVEVQGYQSRLNTAELDSTALNRARLLARRHPRSALGQEYLEIIKLSDIDPDRAILRLEAVIALYGESKGLPPDVRDFVEASRQQLPVLKQRLAKVTAARQQMIQERLSRADELATSDPATSRRIRQAIVDLYRDVPWAKAYVARARAALAAQTPEGLGH